MKCPHPNPLSKTYGPLEMFTAICVSLRQQCEHTDWSARTAFELNRRHDEKRALFRQFAQIRKILKMIESRSERQMMHWKILGCAAIHTDCVTSDAADLTLDQPFDRLHGKSRKMHAPRFILIAILLRVWPS